MIRCLYLFTAAVVMLFLSSCASRPPLAQPQFSEEKPAGAQLTKAKAIDIAKRLAERSGVKLSEHAEPTASYQTSNTNLVWPLMAEGPGEPSFGDLIWVIHFGWSPNTNYPGSDSANTKWDK